MVCGGRRINLKVHNETARGDIGERHACWCFKGRWKRDAVGNLLFIISNGCVDVLSFGKLHDYINRANMARVNIGFRGFPVYVLKHKAYHNKMTLYKLAKLKKVLVLQNNSRGGGVATACVSTRATMDKGSDCQKQNFTFQLFATFKVSFMAMYLMDFSPQRCQSLCHWLS